MKTIVTVMRCELGGEFKGLKLLMMMVVVMDELK